MRFTPEAVSEYKNIRYKIFIIARYMWIYRACISACTA